MKLSKRILAAVLAAASVSVVLCSCQGDATASQAASNPQSTGGETSDTASEGDSGDTGERVKLRMFFGDSGSAVPSGTDVSDEPFINIVEDYANVDLEVIQPAYADFQTQFNLMMTSGDLPDIIHCWFTDDCMKYGDQGAFLDLKEYYDNSPVVQNVISPEVMELSKSPSGHYYRIPQGTNGAKQGYGNAIRYDLLQEYNGGEFPTDVQGYIDFLYWVKETYPDSIPLSCRNSGNKIFLYGEVFFKWYGALPQSYNVIDGEVVSTFVLPQYRDAVELYRQLYADGILDKEFATNDPTAFGAKQSANNVAIYTEIPINQRGSNTNEVANNTGKFWMYTPDLETYPEGVDEVYTKAFASPPISIHGLYISSTSSNPDAAWKVIEGFSSEELREAVTWGTEGEQYTLGDDGKKIPIAEGMSADDFRYGNHFLITWGFGANTEAQDALAEQSMGEEYWALQTQGFDQIAGEAEERGYALIDVYRFTGGLLTAPESIQAKQDEIDQFTAEATVNAITGQISMEEFDQRVETYKSQYAFVDQDWTKVLQDNMDLLVEVGALEASR